MIDHLDDVDLGAVRLVWHNRHPQPGLVRQDPCLDLLCDQLLHCLKVKAFIVDAYKLAIEDFLVCDLLEVEFARGAIFDHSRSEAWEAGVVQLEPVAEILERLWGVHFHRAGDTVA